MLEAIKYKKSGLEVLDQLLLPKVTKYEQVTSVQQGWEMIKSMKVRGAPAISIVGALSLAVELKHMDFVDKDTLHHYIGRQLEYLITSRPTAVNLQRVADSLISHSFILSADKGTSVEEMKKSIMEKAESLLEADISVNKAIGAHGGRHVIASCKQPFVILTHCNTGSLATAGYGTALGVIRWLHEEGNLHHVYCTETRPYNQGARLTAYELVHDKIPATLICDSMVAALMQSGNVSAVVVGADRVVANGDTANKIGTYQIAVCAKYHNVPFYVASPTSTLDMSLSDGNHILIEERPHDEMTSVGSVRIAADGISCWNPAFDVTPASLITGGIITEHGVFPADSLREHNLIKNVI